MERILEFLLIFLPMLYIGVGVGNDAYKRKMENHWRWGIVGFTIILLPIYYIVRKPKVSDTNNRNQDTIVENDNHKDFI